MRILKYTILISVFAAIFCFITVENISAQNPAYNGGSYINQMMRDRMNARRMAAMRAKHRAASKKHIPAKRTRKIYRKPPRASLSAPMIAPKLYYAKFSPERAILT